LCRCCRTYVAAEDELLAEAHRKLAGVDDVFEDINDWFKGVGRNIRRRILQVWWGLLA
jgi:hypothetical protein